MVDRAYLDICIEICTPMMPLGAYIEGCRCISHEAQILRFAQNDNERPLRRTGKSFCFRFFASLRMTVRSRSE